MKKRIMILALSFLGLSVLNAQDQQKKITFAETEYDFGKILSNKPVTHDFVFTNEDTAPIVILEAKATCGCTTPQYPKEPIMPGQKNKLVIGYNAASIGKFYKTIFVSIEGESSMREIVIKGEVLAP